MKILITGAAGFIGSHLVEKLLGDKHKIIGIDNFNTFYDPKIKEENLRSAIENKRFNLYREDILDYKALEEIFKGENPEIVVHLAARAGVRPSIENPMLYGRVNVLGTVNLLKVAQANKVDKFIFSSSSSVYGESNLLPYNETDPCNNIISPYGASKKAAEFWVESFYKTFGMKSVILRLFTVYGPRGRSDMAPSIFTKAIITGKTVTQFGDGSSSRDYTYIDDTIDGIVRSIYSNLDYEVINLGCSNPISLSEFIQVIEKLSGRKAKIKKINKQLGDAVKTWANNSKARKLLGWTPKTDLETGLKSYISLQ